MTSTIKKMMTFERVIAVGQLVLLLAAFFLSVGIAFPELRNYLRGSVVEFYLPSNITFHKYNISYKADKNKDERTKRYYVRLSASMAYTNAGGRDYPAVIQRELISMRFCKSEQDEIKCDARSYDQKWQTFETFVDDNGDLKSIDRKPANPLVIDGRDAVSHDTYFGPFAISCPKSKNEEDCDEWGNYLKWDEFVDKAMDADQIRITMISNLLHLKNIFKDIPRERSFSCAIEVDDYMKYRLKNETWHSPLCQEIREG